MKPESSPRHGRETITAGLFLAALLVVCALWLPQALLSWAKTASPKVLLHPVQALEDLSANAEANLNKALDRNHLFIQLYGGVQRTTGRRILDDVDQRYVVYRLSDGALTFINPNPAPSVAEHAQSTLEFIDLMDSQGRPVLYLQAPQKIGPDGAPSLPAGVTDYGNAWADAFLAALDAAGADTLDLREVLAADGETWTSYFFRTDHHWTPDTAFLCWQAAAQALTERYGLSFPDQAVSRDSFTVTQWDGVFLGSQGKRTGSLYAGVDTLNVWTPNYPTQFTYAFGTTEREGPFDETLLFPERLEEDDPFSANPYTLYSGGDYPLARIINHRNPDGPKIMLLRDSFGCAFAPFLALGCSELTTVDLRYFPSDETFLSYIDWLDPDCVLVLYMPGSLKGEDEFAFFRQGQT